MHAAQASALVAAATWVRFVRHRSPARADITLVVATGDNPASRDVGEQALVTLRGRPSGLRNISDDLEPSGGRLNATSLFGLADQPRL
jgi:hypothetical protein